MILIKQIDFLQKKIGIHKSQIDQMDNCELELKEFTKINNEVTDNWVGSWYENYDVYNDFVNNSSNSYHLSYEELYDYINKKSNLDFTVTANKIKDIVNTSKKINDEIVVELSIIKNNETLLEQQKLLEKLEKFKWGFTSSKIIESQTPNQFMGNIRTAERILSEGFSVPPHINIDANIISHASLIMAVRDHFKLCNRILREIELRIDLSSQHLKETTNSISKLDNLFNKFHDIARQIANRYDKRNTLIINDEYDVQDLLHSLLKLYFDDIRPEEFTPSFAGRNTRNDFLLKNENIVIEVKKTRKTLDDRKVGDELLQDIVRYKNHPNCDILYCFVYDPQGYIKNPIGLENDLNSESSESFKVIVKIKP